MRPISGGQPIRAQDVVTVTRYVNLGMATAVSLITFFFAMIRGGWPGSFILPYLCLVAGMALIPAFFAWLYIVRAGRSRAIGYTMAAVIFYIIFAVSAGLLIPVAESTAERVAIRSGYSSESGPRSFYPDDSGMSNWPTPWNRVPVVALFMGIIWLPLLYVVALLTSRFERRNVS